MPSRIYNLSQNALHTPNLHIVRSISATRSLARDDRPKSTKGLKPKILNENPPTDPAEQSEEVKQHNREMDERAERANAKIENKDAHKDKESPSDSGEKGKFESWTLTGDKVADFGPKFLSKSSRANILCSIRVQIHIVRTHTVRSSSTSKLSDS